MQQPQESEIQLFHAQICQALADPTRILLLYRLAEGPQNVGELAAALSVSQPTVSRHLKVLRERGMVTTTRYGATVEYRLIDDRPIQALDLLRSVLRDNLSRNAELVGVLNEATESKET
ncbi:MAG: winged helix-turn-helix transcriptional regulator [Chloroflexi bacterium]|nr:winged helix-turn-helix transcriptional regulator [Chloroflexota bacterium]